MGRGRALAKCNIAVAGQYREYPYAKVNGWISNLGGSSSQSVSNKTTHVVATEKAWKRQDQAVKSALKLIQKEGIDIKIVSFDWLEDSVNNKTKKREGPYLWTKLDASVKKRDAAQKREQKAKEKKSHMSMMAEVFQEGTEKFMDPKQAREVEKQIEEERRVRESLEEEEKRERKEEERRKKAEIFGRGAKKARNELFTDNHHIYADDTGFKYDIVVTKVDTRHNRNERYAITIYESNAEPHTYATNCQFAGTGHKPANNVIVAIGSPFAPALRTFKICFKEKTGGEWDDRIITAIERQKKQKRDRGQATGSEDQGSRRGATADSQDNDKATKVEEDFEKMPFEYHPPRFGPRGRLPQDKVPNELVPESNKSVENWMSGANGCGPDNTVDLTDGEPNDSNVPAAEEEPVANGYGNVFQEDDGDGQADQPNGVVENGSNGHVDSIFDTDLDKWLGNNMDDVYPFDNNANNLAYLAETNGDFPSLDNTDTAMTDQNAAPTEETAGQQGDASFNQTDTTNAAEPPTSFDLPSTVQESFQHGTQDPSETQVAERARDEFDEIMNAPTYMDGIDHPTADHNNTQSNSFDFGDSILGKRKTPPADSAIEPPAQRARPLGDEEEAFALTAEDEFDFEQDSHVATEAIANDANQEVPRVADNADAGGFASLPAIEDLDYGTADWSIVEPGFGSGD